jgi:DHA1 family tetracycline resistance protein-like MFS transporter
LANAAYGFWILPESLPPEKRRSFSWSRANPIGTWKFLFSIPSLSRLALVGFLYQLAHQVLHNVFVLYTQHRYDWKEREVGLALAAVGVGSVVVQGFLVRRMMARFNEPMLLLTALSFGVAGMLLFGIAPNASWFCLAIPVMAGLGFFMPALQGMMTRQVEAQQQGQLQGATGALQSVAGLIGPMLFTSLFAAVLKREAAPFWTGIPFWVAGLLLLLAIFIAIPAARSYRDS